MLSIHSPSPSAATASAASSTRLDPVRKQKLVKAAHEFEAMLLTSLWKSMKQNGLGEDEQSLDPGSNDLQDLGLQAMSTAVSNAGGLGLAEMIVKQLEPPPAAPHPEAQTLHLTPHR